MAVLSKPFTLLTALAASLTPALGVPVDNLEARQGDFYPINGPVVGGVQPRLEIRDVQANAEMFNLFILATKRFKDMKQSDKLSYFQISGIHGYPLIDWDGSHTNDGNLQVGYCPHSSNLFGPWHRPYLSVFEQIISQKAVEIVNEFPNGPTKDKYRDVASRLRLPFWDWAKKVGNNEPILPVAITQPTVGVTFPNGTKASIENPLLLYRFNPLNPNEIPWSNPTTVRNADGNGNSHPEQTEANLQENKGPLLEQLYQMLTQWQRYNEFSNHGSEPSVIGNIESLHDFIHVTFGNGHMSNPTVAAFDPVFWLHHANVDRFLAIWQRIFPDTYVDPYEQFGGTWTIAPGSIQGVDAPLTPFHKDTRGTYHTSATSRFTDSFQYTYPEIIGNPSNATLKATINRLYAPAVTSITKRQENTPELFVSPEQPRAFLFAIEAPLFVQGGYSVQVFLGNITAPTDKWTSDPNFVGGQTMMARAPNDQIVKGSVVLTESLRTRFDGGALGSLETDEIVKYLKDNLHWRVQKGDKSEIPREDVPNFKVTVLSTEVKPAKSADEFPAFVGGWEEHTDVTAGRPGGVKKM